MEINKSFAQTQKLNSTCTLVTSQNRTVINNVNLSFMYMYDIYMYTELVVYMYDINRASLYRASRVHV